MAGQNAWRVRELTKQMKIHALRLNKDFTLEITFCHGEDDPNCAAPTSAFMDLRFLPMHTSVCNKIVMCGNEGWDPGERVVRSRIAAINTARQWQNLVQKPVRALKLSLKNAEA